MLAIALKPLMAFFLLAVFGVPARIAVQRWMKDGKLKRLLLHKFGDSQKPPR